MGFITTSPPPTVVLGVKRGKDVCFQPRAWYGWSKRLTDASFCYHQLINFAISYVSYIYFLLLTTIIDTEYYLIL